jgi:hypothetical protein
VAELSAPISRPGTILSHTPSSSTRRRTCSCDSDDRGGHRDHVAREQRQLHAGRPWVTPSHIAGTPPATCALPPALRAAMRISVG